MGHIRTLRSLRFDTIGTGLPLGTVITFHKEFDHFIMGSQRPVFLFLRVPLLHLIRFPSTGILCYIQHIILYNQYMLNEHYAFYMFQAFHTLTLLH